MEGLQVGAANHSGNTVAVTKLKHCPAEAPGKVLLLGPWLAPARGDNQNEQATAHGPGEG